MRAWLVGFLSVMIFGGCESPMNQRISGDAQLSLQKTTFSGTSLQAEFKWLDGPHGNIKKTSHLMVFLYKNGNLHSLPEGQTLEFYATMPSMGHPMEDAGFFEEIDQGVYVNKAIRYNMSGDWKNELWIMDENLNILDRLQWLIYF